MSEIIVNSQEEADALEALRRAEWEAEVSKGQAEHDALLAQDAAAQAQLDAKNEEIAQENARIDLENARRELENVRITAENEAIAAVNAGVAAENEALAAENLRREKINEEIYATNAQAVIDNAQIALDNQAREVYINAVNAASSDLVDLTGDWSLYGDHAAFEAALSAWKSAYNDVWEDAFNTLGENISYSVYKEQISAFFKDIADYKQAYATYVKDKDAHDLLRAAFDKANEQAQVHRQSAAGVNEIDLNAALTPTGELSRVVSNDWNMSSSNFRLAPG